jgi:hypothetical protein
VQGAPALDDPANANADFSPRPPVVALTPEEETKRFWLPAGYRMEPVLADPLIEDPAQIVWDGNGRMFVVELRGYFQTPDGIDLVPPEGRISMHEDRDGDGVYERHTVFVDKMVFPRFVLPLEADRHRLELRVESSNITSTPKFANPTSSMTSGDFMRIFSLNSAFTERQTRLALRYSF